MIVSEYGKKDSKECFNSVLDTQDLTYSVSLSSSELETDLSFN